MVFLFGQFSINVEQIINIYRIFYKLSQAIYSISQKYSFLFKKLKVEIKNFIKVIRDVVLIILNHFQPSFLQNYYIFPFHVEPNLCAPNMPCTNQEVEQWGFPKSSLLSLREALVRAQVKISVRLKQNPLSLSRLIWATLGSSGVL